jgi:uncharacterized membrane protein YfcA
MQSVIAILSQPVLPAVLAIAAFAGLVRGFAGFGAALVFVPLASALIDPATAVIMLWVADGLPTMPILFPALRDCRWPQVIPVAAGYALGVPGGVWLLVYADPVSLRWFMAGLVAVLLLLLASGKRYTGEPRAIFGVGVGAASGFLGGATQLSGPPVLAYWLGGPDLAVRIRANVIVFFAIGTLLSGLGFLAAGLFSLERVVNGAAMIPVYSIGIFAGARLFGVASDAAFRRVALGLIAFAAIASLPALDFLLRS